MIRVLVTRPEPGATRTLNALEAKGIEAEAIPLTEIHPLEFEMPEGEFDALVVTSQNAIVHGAPLIAQFQSKPVYVVGKRTAESLGNTRVAAWAETAEELLPKILSQAPKQLLYVCGQTRRPEIELGLKAAGIAVEAIEVYSAKPNEDASAKLKNFFEAPENAIVLFHAPSAAEALISALKPQDPLESTRFLCLSAAIAAHLPAKWQANATIADRPEEIAMLNHLDKMLA